MTWSFAEIEALVREHPVMAFLFGTAAMWVLRRARILLLVAAAVVAWKVDLLGQIEVAYRSIGSRLPVTPEQTHIVEFVLGFLTGLIVLSAALHVRAFAQAALSVLALVVIYVVATKSVPDIIAYAGAAIRHLRQYDLFIKGVLVGKLVAGLVKMSQVRRTRNLRNWRP